MGFSCCFWYQDVKKLFLNKSNLAYKQCLRFEEYPSYLVMEQLLLVRERSTWGVVMCSPAVTCYCPRFPLGRSWKQHLQDHPARRCIAGTWMGTANRRRNRRDSWKSILPACPIFLKPWSWYIWNVFNIRNTIQNQQCRHAFWLLCYIFSVTWKNCSFWGDSIVFWRLKWGIHIIKID